MNYNQIEILKKTFTKSRVLVTGATGFIGSHLVDQLVSLNAQVTVVVRSASSHWRLQKISDKIEYLTADLTQPETLKRAYKGRKFDFLFHLAALTKHDRNPALLTQSFNHNVIGALNLFAYFLNSGIKMVVNIGTCEEYGNNKAPFHELMRESPVSSYSASKVSISHYAQMLWRIYKFPIVTVRPFLTYGPRQTDDNLIPYIIRQTLKNMPFNTTKGEQTREFHYVSDMVEGILQAAATPQGRGEVIDLGTGEEYQVKNVVKLIMSLTKSKSVWKKDLSYRQGEVMHFYCKGEKAKQLFHWQPKINLEKGITRTIAWYKNYLLNKHE